MYEFNSRIRYSEVDSEGKLSMGSLLNYFQDCSTFHSEDLGVGIGYLADRHLAWVLAAWQIVVDRYPGVCENVIIGTAPYEFRGFLGCRNFRMRTVDGEQLACANTLWTLMNMENMHPVKPTEDMLKAYALEERLPMDYAPRKITIPDNMGKTLQPIEVRHHHLDTNNHVNNGQYISIAMEYLPEGFETGQMRAEYKKQALLGAIIKPVIYEAGNHIYTIVLNNEEDKPYCIAEFTPFSDRRSSRCK